MARNQVNGEEWADWVEIDHKIFRNRKQRPYEPTYMTADYANHLELCKREAESALARLEATARRAEGLKRALEKIQGAMYYSPPMTAPDIIECCRDALAAFRAEKGKWNE